MKKIISLILAVILAFGCICIPASAASFVTEKGVQVEIASYLYKSVLYPMEFPSAESYEIKEKSLEGDYAISRELNDMSYTFVFPAGTTEIECYVSLDGQTNWRGVTVNSTEHSLYWPKDANGNVDYSQPMTFKRDEVTAERDEYGLLYREYLKGKDVKGFRDYDKIYWRLRYVCGGETLTEYFDIKLYDYDKLDKQTVKIANFNVAGLSFSTAGGSESKPNQTVIGKYLSNNNFDIVAVQEDFGYHKNLLEGMSGFGYATNYTGGIPGGDGLNVFTTTMPIYNEKRVTWNEACGILSDGSDELTPKGFMYTVIDIGNGIYVDFYNLHADSYGGAGSVAARTSQFKQLAEFIQARSAENDRPVIVTGDFNNYIHTHEDNGALYNSLCIQTGLKDAWVEFHNNGDYFNMYNWHISGLPAWGNWDSVERFMYKSGGGVELTVSDFRYTDVRNDAGNSASDHSAAECEFTFIKTADFVENTQELKIVKDNVSRFFNSITWFFKILTMILSDLDNLPALLEDLM